MVAVFPEVTDLALLLFVRFQAFALLAVHLFHQAWILSRVLIFPFIRVLLFLSSLCMKFGGFYCSPLKLGSPSFLRMKHSSQHVKLFGGVPTEEWFRSVISGDEETILRMLRSNPTLLHQKDVSGDKALHKAAAHGHEAVARLLLENRADVNATDDGKATPLHLAALFGHEALARLLLENRADVSATTIDQRTPLHWAKTGTMRMLLQQATEEEKRKEEARRQAIEEEKRKEEARRQATEEEKRKEEARRQTIEEEKRKEEARRDWFISAERGDTQKISSLLRSNPTLLHQQDDAGYTALHKAALNGREAVAMLLLEHRIDLSTSNWYKETPLHLASRNGHEAVARLLLEHRADLSANENSKLKPLHLAAFNGHEAVTRLLLEHRAELNALSNDKKTPLHLAALNGHEAVTRLLLEHRADLNALTNDKQTPLHLAAEYGREAVARLLLKHRADLSTNDKWERTPLRVQAIEEEERRLFKGMAIGILVVVCFILIQRWFSRSKQCTGRRRLAIKQASELQKEKKVQISAATAIQCTVRRHLSVQKVLELQMQNKAAKVIQGTVRSHLAIQKFVELQKQNKAATVIQEESETCTFGQDLKMQGFTDIYEALSESGVNSYANCSLIDDEFWAILQEDNSHIPRAKLLLVKRYISSRCAENPVASPAAEAAGNDAVHRPLPEAEPVASLEDSDDELVHRGSTEADPVEVSSQEVIHDFHPC